ncbi:MAG: hypothetical protein CME61_00950 [Halobacteriovoraceae bacterium]|nr:hypothetical protein [Halobacteriovoraceae bacterium]
MERYVKIPIFILVIAGLFVFFNARKPGESEVTATIKDDHVHSPGLDFPIIESEEQYDVFRIFAEFQEGRNIDRHVPLSYASAVKIVDKLWEEYPIVDGVLEPDEVDINFTQLMALPTQTKVMSGKIIITHDGNPYFSETENVYNQSGLGSNPTIRIVRSAKDLSCIHTDDYTPEFLHYQQKPWATNSTNENVSVHQLELEVKYWIDFVSRIMQPEYNERSNEELYEDNAHYAGSQFGNPNDGLTRKGEILSKSYLKYGGILDASHTRNNSFYEMINISRQFQSSIGLPAPILLNHANIDGNGVVFPSYLQNDPARFARNKTPKEICLSAKTGGVWGVMPIRIFTDDTMENADFYDLADQIFYIKNHKCFQRNFLNSPTEMTDFKGEKVKLINHIIVSSDATVDYYDKNNSDHESFYIDEDAADPLKWKKLAVYLLTHDFNNDGFRDFSVMDLKKIFALNAIRSYVRGLDGALPFSEDFCSLSGRKKIFFGNFLNSSRSDVSIIDDNKLLISKSYLKGHFEKVNKATYHNSWCKGLNKQVIVGDFDGNGFDDFLCYKNGGSFFNIRFKNNGNYTKNEMIKTKSPCGINQVGTIYSADVNGDGKDEVICQSSNNGIGAIEFLSGRNKRKTKYNSMYSNFCYQNGSKFLIGRLNNDNKDDFYCHYPDGSYEMKLNGVSPKSFNIPTFPSKKKWCRITNQLRIYLGDFDGDGVSDRLCHSRNNGRLWIDFKNNSFKGTDWSEYGWSYCTSSSEQVFVTDTGGDKKDDVLCYDQRTGYLSTLRGDESSLVKPKDFTIE